MTFWDMVKCGLASAPFRVGWKSAARVLQLTVELEPHHKELVPGPHCYLQVIGIHEDFQGQGLGSVMARYVLDSVDTANMPCYVESSNPLNVPFYQRLGFVVARQVVVDDCPPIDLLVRPPSRTPIPVGLSSFASPPSVSLALSPSQRSTANQINLLANGVVSLRPSRLTRIIFWFVLLIILLILAYHTYDY